MSEYNKPQDYNAYVYNPATRPEHGQDYSQLGAHQAYASQYVGTQAQVPSGLPQSTGLPMVPVLQQYSGPHDTSYYDQPYAQHPAYLASAPRRCPEIISYTPIQGLQGTRVTVYIRSVYDLDAPPVATFLMFGTHKCQTKLTKTAQHVNMYSYAVEADVPPFPLTNSPSPVPLHLLFDDSTIAWDSPSLELGTFTYLDAPVYYPMSSPQAVPRKRKLSSQASPRRSPPKKPSTQQLATIAQSQSEYAPSVPAGTTPASPFRRPSLPDAYLQNRRVSASDYPPMYSAPPPPSQQYYGSQAAQTAPLLQTAQSPSWSYQQALPSSTTRSPSAAALSAGSKTSQLLPSPAVSNPPLIRTSTMQQSPTTPGPSTASTQTFNPYGMYPSNAKAILKLEGDLNSMVNEWTTKEWEDKRRLVQFRRSQSGSVISATFEAVPIEMRATGSICVSCIWWEEKQECYVTSVDTISLLEALVAVRFTVEEKNRIRRNLEGFRPATVSKTKQDSEEFFKLIMGFPNPKPRNIEKDVKVFPWRILATALKKIIGKYSASYSSTAGTLHTPVAGPSYTTGRSSETGIEQQRPAASPRSTSSSATSHGYAYATAIPAMTTTSYSPHVAASANMGVGPSAGPLPDLRLAVPVSAASQTTSWHQPSTHYSSDLSANRVSFDYNSFLSSSPATGLPSSAQSYQYQQHRYPSITSQSGMPVEARFVPLQHYEEQSQPTSTS